MKKGGQQLCYTFECCKNSGLFDILNDISKYVTLVQLLDKFGDVSNAVSIARNWIFYSNLQKSTFIGKIIIGYYFSFDDDYDSHTYFKEVYYAVFYINPKPILKLAV